MKKFLTRSTSILSEPFSKYYLQGTLIHNGPLENVRRIMLLGKTAEEIRWAHEVEAQEGERIQRNKEDTRKGRTLKKGQL